MYMDFVILQELESLKYAAYVTLPHYQRTNWLFKPFFLLFFLSLALSLVLSTNSFYLALFAFSFSFVLYAHTYLVFIASFVVCCLLCVCVLLLFDPSVFVWLLCLFVELVLINFAFTHLLLRRRITMIWCFLFSFNCPLFSTILNSHLAFNQNTILCCCCTKSFLSLSITSN